MCATILAEERERAAAGIARRLYVSWQDADRRSFVPVGVLTWASDGSDFRYLSAARDDNEFRPFIGFPDLGRVYRSTELFPFFENRLMPRSRPDYPAYLAALGLPGDADPFEVLARSGGDRATDTIEVVAEPLVDDSGYATCHFLVRGVRHVEGADDAIDSLSIDDLLSTEPDVDNPYDDHARYVVTLDGAHVGYVPSYLTAFLARAAEGGGE
ncbi:MAG: hypothetical protein M1522_00250, partial [Actinobacteria bacterium]|nr:hypothetical protein [Actinomycetota bacterium]